MFSQRPYQSQIIQEDIQRRLQKHESTKKIVHRTLREKTKNYLSGFLEASSIHGLNHLVAIGRHPFEVSLWLIMVFLSVFGTLFLSRTTWMRYQYSPTVVSMDRDMYAWNTTFPCVTICLDKKIDPDKLSTHLKNTKEPDKEKLEAFILTLANSTFDNFNLIPEYDAVEPMNYLELILNLSFAFTPTLTIGASGVSLQIVPTVTEMGLCYAINSKVAVYNSPEYREANRWDIIESENATFFVHPLDGEVFAQALRIASAYNVYIHGPLEVPDISTKYRRSVEKYYMKIYVTALTVYTSPEAAKLSVAQRRCRFQHENVLKHNAVYTYTLCRMECRLQLCLKYCQCVPYFYRNIRDEKICDVKGMHCLARHKDELSNLRDKEGKKMECECFPICDDVNYIIQSHALQNWFLGTNFQWGIVTYPRMRYRRDIIFGFTDVLVAVGGMAGLFLGCSVLSFMEIIYYLTIRLYFYNRNYQ